MITESHVDKIRIDMQKHLSEKRYRHTIGVEKEMRALAKIYMPESEAVAACAGLLHDITKEFPYAEHMKIFQKYFVELSGEEKASAALLHAKSGAIFARECYPSLVDEGIFSAIRKHTTADEDMSLLDKLLYLADFIEEGRPYSGCLSVRRAFYDGIKERVSDKHVFLNEILIKAYDASLEALEREGHYVSPATLLAKKRALEELNSF